MSVSLNGTNGLTFADSSTQNTGGYTGFRNRIINGDMRIDQRNAGAATANTISGYTVDRWAVNQTTTGKLIAQQNAGSITPPAGFTNYLGVTSQSAYSVLSSDYYGIVQPIEGFNTADLGFGTASASTVTLSFWVRSSLTGTFGGALLNNSVNRSYPFTYTISAANTWEQKAITIAGDQSGTWVTNNLVGLYVNFGLGVGSTFSGTAGSWAGALYRSATGATSVVGTSGATFYITGVQLEKGSVATPFERRPYGTELQLCQRYYQKCYSINVVPGTATSDGRAFINFPVSGTLPTSTSVAMRVEMRSAPTVTPYDFNGSAGACFKGGNGKLAGAASVSTNAFSIYTTDSTNTNEFGFMWTASAEL